MNALSALTNPDLDAIEARWQAASGVDRDASTLRAQDWEALQAFQSAAYTDVPRLVAEVRRLRAELAARQS
jgi:hypothetical protein